MRNHASSVEIFAPPESVGAVIVPVPALPPTASWQLLEQAFAADSTLHAVPLVEADGRPVALVNRADFARLGPRPPDLPLTDRSVRELLQNPPLVVDVGTSIDDLSRLIAHDAGRAIYDGFIATYGGRYAGTGTGYALVQALTDRRQAHLFHVAHHDVLTGLPNRHLFLDRLRQAIGGAERTHRPVAVMVIDVDRFKGLNDTLGHAQADRLLRVMATRLAGHVRKGDTVARLEGDKFGVVLANLMHPDDALVVARKMLAIIGEPLQLDDDEELRVSCSVGVSLYPQHGARADLLLQCADAAVYHAKQIRNTFQVFSKEMMRPARGRCTYTSLVTALEEQQLRVFYQPQVTVATGAVESVEALVRWQHPEDGIIPADEVVAVAEDTGLITHIFEWLLRNACQQVRDWSAARGQPLRLSVNVSSVQFREERLLPAVANILAATGFDPRSLELEITETVVMRNAKSTIAALRHLRSMGVRIAIDDFGVGYSSLSYLRHLPLDVLKIDRMFVREIGVEERGAAIVRAIITLAHSLRLSVVAEGVETLEQFEVLRAEGCDSVQGYLFSPPLATEDAIALLGGRKRQPR